MRNVSKVNNLSYISTLFSDRKTTVVRKSHSPSRQTNVKSPSKMTSKSPSLSPSKLSSPRKTAKLLWKGAKERGFTFAQEMKKRADKLVPNMSSEQGFYWDNDGVLKKVLKRKREKGQRKVRVEIPPISWFYESGGMSPRRKKPVLEETNGANSGL